ncbi:TetR/AcrR family transcriptional regulator [Blastococcus sp. URHD0036]|uniref:TetR/AcrR family transcriptional regulator n=1 Tax=Blastococcus sp. URHD0036 TaxID=1380356 RepID=UPI0018CC6BBA|nr:TetR/AcrR family transcriptional regulator [Blastococcus sp. URHD0036]
MSSPPSTAPRVRAARLSPDDRRAALLDGVIPLVQAHGRAISTRQIAEACGVAEGTIFRAFGTKEALIEAAIERYFSPQRFAEALATVPPTLPVEEKLRTVLLLVQDRLRGVVGVLAAVREQPGPEIAVDRGDRRWLEPLRELLAPDAARLAVPVETVGQFLLLVALGTSLPHLAGEFAGLSADDLVRLVTHGVLTGHGGED